MSPALVGTTVAAFGGWRAAESSHPDEAAEALADELGLATGALVEVEAPASAEEWVGSESFRVLRLHRMAEVEVERLDAVRDRLRGAAVVVGTRDELDRVAVGAPHFWSWLGAQVVEVTDEDRQVDPESRLIALREHTGLDDAEVVRRAERGELPSDPVFAEWLVLLDRGDLVGPR